MNDDALFATKGVEYLLVIGYLVLLTTAVVIARRRRRGGGVALRESAAIAPAWFQVPRDFFFHPAHTWARKAAEGRLRIGMDDLAQKLLGPISDLNLPAVGSRLEAGTTGARLRADGQWIDLIAPVTGTVATVNQKLSGGDLDPYGTGWLFEVEVEDEARALRNLLSGEHAEAWMAADEASIRDRCGEELGVVLQEGGTVAPGFARLIDPERWADLARRYLGNPPRVA